jgi:ribonuclease HII
MKRGREDRKIICGVDEAGRGTLAGPVIAAAVILNPDEPIDGLNDSKLLSPAKRLKLFSEIIKNAVGFAAAGVSCLVIDEINILQASLLAMRKAVEKLHLKPDIIYVDGRQTIPGLTINQKAIIGGDRLIPQISAASIVAKVARDSYMHEMAKIYPDYGFDRHKGYCTKEHVAILEEIGPCPIHRKSFNPIAQYSLWKQA